MRGLEGGVGRGVEVVEERGELHAHFEWVGHGGGAMFESEWCDPSSPFKVGCSAVCRCE